MGSKSFKDEGRNEASGADEPSTGVPGFSTKVTPPPESAVLQRQVASTSPTPTFRSKVATLRPPELSRPDNEGEVIDLMDSVPPSPPSPPILGATPNGPAVTVQTREPTLTVRRRRMGFAAIAGCLFVAALVGWFLSRKLARPATTPVADASTGQVASATPALAVPSAAVADKVAPIDNAPAPSMSAGSVRKPKPGAPRPSRPFKARHK